MRVAFPIWDDMVSPVLDTSANLRIVTIEDGVRVSDRSVALPRNLQEMAASIAKHADILICGALSCQLEQELHSLGIRLHPWVMGVCESILGSVENGTIEQHEYSMPGCRHRGQRSCGNGNRRNRSGKV